MSQKPYLEKEDPSFFEVLRRRHSIRSYTDKEIEDWKLKQILEAVNSAPSAGNLQAYDIFVVHNRRKKHALAKAAGGQYFISEAPIVLVFCAVSSRSSWKYGSRGEQLYCIQDATIAAAYAQLAATALGLASIWVGAFDEKEALEALGQESEFRPLVIMPIGYTVEKPEIAPRRRLEECLHII